MTPRGLSGLPRQIGSNLRQLVPASLRGRRAALAWRLLSAAAIVAIGLWRLDLHSLGSALARVSVLAFAAACLLLLVGQAVSALRWCAISRRLGAAASQSWFVRAYLRGCFYNMFLPTAIGGDAMRVAVLRHEIGVSKSGQSVVYDRATGLAAFFVTAAVVLPWTSYLEPPWLRVGISVAGGLATVAVTGVLAHRRMLNILLLTIGFQLVWLAGVWSVARATGVSLDPIALPVVVTITGIAMALPISIGGTGTREAGMAIALAPLGVGTSHAVAIGICFGIALAVVGLVGAPIAVPRATPPSPGDPVGTQHSVA